jgi:CheY-like chemotaxis protein
MKVDATWVGHSRAGYSNCGVRSWRNNVLFQRRHSQLNGLMQSFKLLNDEEHRDARKDVYELFEEYQQGTFNDPKEALSKFKPGSYDLIILDIKMPKMDGFELYHEIKKKDNNAKVCFLTASELYYEEFRNKEYCALDRNLFIRKPIDNEDLVKEINKMIKK